MIPHEKFADICGLQIERSMQQKFSEWMQKCVDVQSFNSTKYRTSIKLSNIFPRLSLFLEPQTILCAL